MAVEPTNRTVGGIKGVYIERFTHACHRAFIKHQLYKGFTVESQGEIKEALLLLMTKETVMLWGVY
jgi:hypothetical protein